MTKITIFGYGKMAETIIDVGVCEGVDIETSRILVYELFNGFSTMLQNKISPLQIRLDTTSPGGGTTAEAIQVLEDSGVRGAIRKAIHNANKKANSIS